MPTKTLSKRKSNKPGLAESQPWLAKEWHPTLNGDLTPYDIAGSSKDIVWWQCSVDKSHEWEASPDRRVYGNSGCPCCLNMKIVPGNSLASVRPDMAKLWHPTRNDGLTPDQVAPKSGITAWWQCPKDKSHEWDAIVKNLFNARVLSCPMCNGKRVSKTNSLAARYPEIAAQWHPTKNDRWKPSMFTAKSHKKFWWLCSNGHEWEAIISNRTGKGQDCPKENLLSDHYPEVAAQWHPKKNAKLKPSDVSWGSDRVVWWLCENKHAWEASIRSRTVLGKDCSVCKTLAFRYPAVARNWHPTRNGKLTPKDVKAGSPSKVWWKCALGHVWTAAISAVVYCWRNHGTNGCRKCFSEYRSNSSAATTLKGRAKTNRRNRILEDERADEDELVLQRKKGHLI